MTELLKKNKFKSESGEEREEQQQQNTHIKEKKEKKRKQTRKNEREKIWKKLIIYSFFSPFFFSRVLL